MTVPIATVISSAQVESVLTECSRGFAFRFCLVLETDAQMQTRRGVCDISTYLSDLAHFSVSVNSSVVNSNGTYKEAKITGS